MKTANYLVECKIEKNIFNRALNNRRLNKMNKNLIISIVVTILTAIVAVSAATNDYGTCPGYGMMNGGYGSSFMILSWITYILLIALIIAAIYWLIKNANKRKK
jgi:uncharacterized membrane protein